jgi:hypothetical protein
MKIEMKIEDVVPLGYVIELEGKRLVFVGKLPGNILNSYYVGFRNFEGSDTKLKLSKEAMEALIQLYSKLEAAPGTDPFPERESWAVVEE